MLERKSTLNFLSFDSEVPTSRQRYWYPPNGKKKVRVPGYGENYVKSSYAPTKEALQKRHKYPMVDTKKKQGNEKKKKIGENECPGSIPSFPRAKSVSGTYYAPEPRALGCGSRWR